MMSESYIYCNRNKLVHVYHLVIMTKGCSTEILTYFLLHAQFATYRDQDINESNALCD